MPDWKNSWFLVVLLTQPWAWSLFKNPETFSVNIIVNFCKYHTSTTVWCLVWSICTYSSFKYIIYSYCNLYFIFFQYVLINVSWLTWCGGTLRYLGESVMVCTWGCHFSLHEREARPSALASLLRVTATAQMARCMCRHSHQNRSWHHQSIVWWWLASYGDILMMWGI